MLGCEIASSNIARVTLGSQQNLLVSGTITQFVNPFQTKAIEGMVATLFDARGERKLQSKSLSINTFTPADMGVTLTSSSPVVGATECTLYVTVYTWTVIPKTGLLVVHLPDYYKDAGSDFMVEPDLEPCELEIT